MVKYNCALNLTWNELLCCIFNFTLAAKSNLATGNNYFCIFLDGNSRDLLHSPPYKRQTEEMAE